MRQVGDKTDGYVGFRHRILYVTRGSMDRLKNVAEQIPDSLKDRVLMTTYDLVMDSETDAIWYGVSFRKAVALPR